MKFWSLGLKFWVAGFLSERSRGTGFDEGWGIEFVLEGCRVEEHVLSTVRMTLTRD